MKLKDVLGIHFKSLKKIVCYHGRKLENTDEPQKRNSSII